MEGSQFDDLARSLTESRRSLLAGSLALAAGWLGLTDADARKKRKHKQKHKRKPKPEPKPEPNEYGCLDVGQACNGDSGACCSGICEGTAPRKGKKDTSRCVAHDADICTPGSNACLFEGVLACGPSDADCYCLRTTGNAPFCGNTGEFDELALLCRDCSQDTDCHEEFGPAAACVDIGEGICESLCPNTGGTACVPACPDADM
jgi:hypothetical protein